MNHCTKEQLIAFERRIADLWEAGDLPYLLHFSGGNEDQLIEIFKEVQPGDWVFSTHRNHYHALLSGMAPARLEALIREGNSMFVYERARVPGGEVSGGTHGNHGPEAPCYTCETNFLTSSVLAGTCGIAAGVAWSIKDEGSRKKDEGRMPHVWCFLGDGAEDEGHFYEAAMLVRGHNLPCTFIIEDNDRSVDTDKATRRGPWESPDFGAGVRRYHYRPTYPHAGSGCKQHITFKPLKPKSNKA